MKKLLDDLRAIAEGKDPRIEYNLHPGLKRLIDAFGGAEEALDWFKEYEEIRQPIADDLAI